MKFTPNNIQGIDADTIGIECLTKDQGLVLVLIDKDDYKRVKMFRWSIDSHGYAISKAFTGTNSTLRVKMHRLIMSFPEGLLIDHKDMNKINNKKINLRTSSKTTNSANRFAQSNNKLKIKGVTFRRDRNKFRATIGHKGKQYFLGNFETAEEAKNAYNLKAKELFGEFFRE